MWVQTITAVEMWALLDRFL